MIAGECGQKIKKQKLCQMVARAMAKIALKEGDSEYREAYRSSPFETLWSWAASCGGVP